MSLRWIARLLGMVIELVDDLLFEIRTRMVARYLLQNVAAMAAKYRAARRNQSPRRLASKMCLVLEEIDPGSASWERIERQRLSRRLEAVRQAILVADEIIDRTFSPRGTARAFPRFIRVPSSDFRHRAGNGDGSPR